MFDRADFERRQVMLPNPNLSDEDEFLRQKPRHSFEILDNGLDSSCKWVKIPESGPVGAAE
jgi:hypothetical protein